MRPSPVNIALVGPYWGRFGLVIRDKENCSKKWVPSRHMPRHHALSWCDHLALATSLSTVWLKTKRFPPPLSISLTRNEAKRLHISRITASNQISRFFPTLCNNSDIFRFLLRHRRTPTMRTRLLAPSLFAILFFAFGLRSLLHINYQGNRIFIIIRSMCSFQCPYYIPQFLVCYAVNFFCWQSVILHKCGYKQKISRIPGAYC